MSIYIKGIDMPKGEGNKLVLQIFPNGEVYDEHGIRLGIREWSEAIQLPPHGRLGDLDALYKLFLNEAKEHMDLIGAALLMITVCISNATTIIPAEEG